MYEGHVQTARDNAMETAGMLCPSDVWPEHYIAWHAYMLTFEERMVKDYDMATNKAIYGPVSSNDDVAQDRRVL